VTGTSMTLLTVDTKLMPILPLILRPDSKTDLTIAFGMGSAWRAALNAGLTATSSSSCRPCRTCSGLLPGRPEGAGQSQGQHHHRRRPEPRGADRPTYDIIVVDPPPPIETAGVSVISSLEFYQAAKAR
jgi:spermidine synthase